VKVFTLRQKKSSGKSAKKKKVGSAGKKNWQKARVPKKKKGEGKGKTFEGAAHKGWVGVRGGKKKTWALKRGGGKHFDLMNGGRVGKGGVF